MVHDEVRRQHVYSFMPIVVLIFTTIMVKNRRRPKLERGHSALVFDSLIIPDCGSY